jgi:hypothetical protein
MQMNAPVPQQGISHVDSGLASWNTYAIYKDNDTRRDYSFVELVSAMGGNDVGVITAFFDPTVEGRLVLVPAVWHPEWKSSSRNGGHRHRKHTLRVCDTHADRLGFGVKLQ